MITVKKSFAEMKDTNIEAGLKESFTKESGKYESKSLLNNCIAKILKLNPDFFNSFLYLSL